MPGYNLFLDDIRRPVDAYVSTQIEGDGVLFHKLSLKDASGIDDNDWVIVRSYDDFVFMINGAGLPSAISFDHDLHEEHIKHYFTTTQGTGIIEYCNFKHKTGKHCAEYLVEFFSKTPDATAPKLYIHSANEYGRIEIARVLEKLA